MINKMEKVMRVGAAATFALLVGCVTINIYFPEAAAEQAADRIIDEVRGESEFDSGADAGANAGAPLVQRLFARVFDVIIPAASAQANFDATSPASRALEQSLKKRFPKVKPYLDSGAIGLTAAGLLDIRDRNAVPLKARNALRQLVTQQNTDWEALYKEIARINDHPEWIDQIRQVFAKRWVAKARPGWYYRDSGGNWQQK
ncbi:MAG: DUF1318 domain-containing protein [Gammaproteobacteria bacterium]